MSELKMVDVFVSESRRLTVGNVKCEIYQDIDHNMINVVGKFETERHARYAAHAIKSHDQLVDKITEQEKAISELVDNIQLNTEILTAIMERKPLQGSDYHAISCTIKNNELLIAKHKQSKGE